MNAYARDDAFYFPIRVFYEDTDAGGIVYHSNFFNFAERARTEWLRHLAIGRERLQEEFGLMFVVRRATIEWRRPARLDDLLMVETRLQAIGKVRMTLRQTITRGETLLATIDVEVVAVSIETFAPTLLPDALRALLPTAPEMEEPKKQP
ncbi:MAG: tol-pal system-associated acyl-CoA thioesterase [Alphaproteobacteria bacterium]|nr:tol-pal system-associated acyl-CoA thioesterase [Alphaproteobacteria bacterium]